MFDPLDNLIGQFLLLSLPFWSEFSPSIWKNHLELTISVYLYLLQLCPALAEGVLRIGSLVLQGEPAHRQFAFASAEGMRMRHTVVTDRHQIVQISNLCCHVRRLQGIVRVKLSKRANPFKQRFCS